jgi:hypothetical protein
VKKRSISAHKTGKDYGSILRALNVTDPF